MNNKEVGNYIATMRKLRGLTQEELAHKIGKTGDNARAYINKIERGTLAVQYDYIIPLAEALQVEVNDLCTLTVPLDSPLQNRLAEVARNLSEQQLRILLAYAEGLKAMEDKP